MLLLVKYSINVNLVKSVDSKCSISLLIFLLNFSVLSVTLSQMFKSSTMDEKLPISLFVLSVLLQVF